MTPEDAAALRLAFDPAQIGQLPKGGTTLDYVGHAAVTDRLLKVDPLWSWEPVALDADGGPLIRYGDNEAELWIRLTVCGHTRLGVGTCSPKKFELAKQLISDALRNAAMRFGVGLDLWSKEDLDGTGADHPTAARRPEPSQGRPTAAGATCPGCSEPISNGKAVKLRDGVRWHTECIDASRAPLEPLATGQDPF